MEVDINNIIKKYHLKKHPEGGYYSRFYESKTRIDYNGFSDRAIMTAIYYLLRENQISCFHKIDADEMWHYLWGNTTLIIHIIYTNGNYEKVYLGKAHDKHQFCVPAYNWFAAEIEDKDKRNFAFIDCTVSPGFLFETFVMAEKSNLKKQFPQFSNIIDNFTAKDKDPIT